MCKKGKEGLPSQFFMSGSKKNDDAINKEEKSISRLSKSQIQATQSRTRNLTIFWIEKLRKFGLHL